MSDITGIMTVPSPQHRASRDHERPVVWDRLSILAAWALAVSLFLTVGWMALAPSDPLGPVSLWVHSSPISTLCQAAALAGVVAALATVVAGKQLVDVGAFAATVGLALVALRGATAEYLLVQHAGSSGSGQRALAWAFAFETIGWILVVMVAVAVSALVARWCYADVTPGPVDVPVGEPFARPLAAGLDCPGLSSRFFRVPRLAQTPPVSGLQHTCICAGVGILVISLLYTGHHTRTIDHGQVCFVLGAGAFAGTYFAYRAVPVRSALWSITAIGIVALLAYVWSGLQPFGPGTGVLPPNIPSSRFMRALPIQFVCVGTAAAIATFWYVYDPYLGRAGRREATSPPASPSGERR